MGWVGLRWDSYLCEAGKRFNYNMDFIIPLQRQLLSTERLLKMLIDK